MRTLVRLAVVVAVIFAIYLATFWHVDLTGPIKVALAVVMAAVFLAILEIGRHPR